LRINFQNISTLFEQKDFDNFKGMIWIECQKNIIFARIFFQYQRNLIFELRFERFFDNLALELILFDFRKLA
jgi:hypothetical protein